MAFNLLHANDRPGEYPESWYATTMPAQALRPALKGSHKADVCIVGAGYTGLSAALHLAEAGYKVIVVEAHRIAWGASGRNGGQAGTGQRRGQDELEQLLGFPRAKLLWELGEDAKGLVRRLIDRFAIDCDVTPGIIHADHKPRYAPHSRAYAEKLHEAYSYPHIRYAERDEMLTLVASRDYHGGTVDTDAFHLNPLKYAIGLARAAEAAGALIYEKSEVMQLVKGDPALLRLEGGDVQANHVLLACNGYLGGLEPSIASRVMPINNFVIVTEPMGQARANALISNNAAVADSRFVINYFRRTPDHRLLFGGGETYCGYRFPPDIKAFTRRPMLKVFPQLADLQVDFGWGGTLAITAKRLPALRRVSSNILSASGYSGHGITIATHCGKLAGEAINGQSARFDVYAALPSMAFPGGTMMRAPLLGLALNWYALRDRL